MKKRAFMIPVIALSLIGIILTGCAGGGATGRLQVYANGEDFIHQGFVSKDGWSINFDHVYITLTGITAYQTDPPYDPHSGADISGKAAVSLDNVYTVDLAEGDENAPPILVAEVSGASAGHYNAISWEMVKASSGPAAGYSLVIIGIAEKDGRSVDFTINVDEECGYSCGEYVGDERRGILEKGGTADLEMTFHFDHIFGDADTATDDGLNVSALGFNPFADVAGGGQVDLDMAELHLGHVGEGHCHCECY
jgi:hypothetical protein